MLWRNTNPPGRTHWSVREDGMKIKRIEHIAIAVDDLDGMAGMLRDKFGIVPPAVFGTPD